MVRTKVGMACGSSQSLRGEILLESTDLIYRIWRMQCGRTASCIFPVPFEYRLQQCSQQYSEIASPKQFLPLKAPIRHLPPVHLGQLATSHSPPTTDVESLAIQEPRSLLPWLCCVEGLVLSVGAVLTP